MTFPRSIKIIYKLLFLGALFPAFTISATGSVTDFYSLVQLLLGLLKSLVPLLIGLAVVMLFFGIVRYVTAGDSEENRKEARNLMIYGLIALFVMVSVWGLVGVLSSTFFGGNFGVPQLR